MDKKTLIIENVHNLTSLWKDVSLPLQGFFERDAYTYYKVTESEWPNRLVFHDTVGESAFAKANSEYLEKEHPAHLSFFEHYNEDRKDLLSSKLEVRSIQYGMCLELQNKFDKGGRIQLKKAVDGEDALLWAELFEKCFNYRTHHKQVLLPIEHTFFYLVHNENNEPIGTIITHSENQNVLGIHSMGIIPDARRKGYAQELMETILKLSSDHGFRYAVLQASEMAVPLYEKLGFEHQFKMTNYIKKS